MSNQRGKFAKRQREMDLKDKARAKQERRAAKRTEVRVTKGPQIAWDEAVHAVVSDDEAPAEAKAPGLDGASEASEGAAGAGGAAGPAAHAADPVDGAGGAGAAGSGHGRAGDGRTDPASRRRT
jgi:hypothetical protein